MQFFRRSIRLNKTPRIMVLGLDCASPDLIFSEFKDDLPTLSQLMSTGTWGVLNSSIPCITIPAWSSMMTGRDPGELGFYGFRNRVAYDYESLAVVNSTAVKFPRVWDILSDADKSNYVAAVPQTFPPSPLKGHLISGFLSPNTGSHFTYPAVHKQEVLKITPGYAFDVKDFRTDDKTRLEQHLIDLTNIQFKTLEHAVQHKAWDFFMHVNIGVDRVHHGFWRYHDPQHRFYEPDSPFKDTIRNYYKLVDSQISRLVTLAGDDTTILIVSDHGVKRMDGGICINEWLWRNGWLTFKIPPKTGEINRFDPQNVDWENTKAWGMGGYYGRIFLNVADREPAGTIPQDAYEATRDTLSEALKAITVPDHPQLSTTVMKPEDIYAQVNNIAPDLMVYFGDLHWRSVGSLGHGQHYTYENDTGPDDANHAAEGMFILNEPHASGMGQVNAPYQLMDIAPTLLNRMKITIPSGMRGQIIDNK